MDQLGSGSYALMLMIVATTLLPMVGLMVRREHQLDVQQLTRLRR